MNEGKPPTKYTRPRWFGRTRPPADPTAAGAEAATPSLREDHEGDYELARPAPTGTPPSTEAGTTVTDEPASSAEPSAPAEVASASVPEGLPGAPASDTAVLPAGPESATDGPPPDAGEGVATPGSGPSGVASRVAGEAAVAPVAGPVSPVPVAPPAGRPRPLHDPDPYDTPPYGEPGPWAPAPPVQHPTLASAPPAVPAPVGTPVAPPAPVPPSGHAPVGAGATVPGPAGAPSGPVPAGAGAPVPTPAHPSAGPATSVPYPVHPPAGQGAPVPPPAQPPAGPGTPAHPQAEAGAPGGPLGPVAPDAPAGHDLPASQMPPAGHGIPAPRPAPTGPGAPAPQTPLTGPGTTPHQAPEGRPAPHASPAGHGTPHPLHPPAPADRAGVPPTGDAPAAADHTAADSPPAGGGPWGRYDPWAAAPLQESGAGQGSAERRRRRVRRALVGGAVALAVVSGLLGGVAGAYFERNGGIGAVELPQAGKEPAGRAPDSVAGIAARALPSVVTLHVSGSDEQGTGTGFVLDGLGHILTNNHVVEPAASGGAISVTFSGGQTAKARIVGRDTGYDLAVVQVSGVRGLTPLPLGNSDNVQVGDPVVAIGAPFDLANTVTSGIISAKERPITAGGEKGEGGDVSYVDALQTDAPINPGNSGGPLLDSRGRVIGINSAIRSADTGSDVQTGQAGSIGLGFAIPVNQAKRVAEELINTGRASHPVIGVTLDMNYTGDGAKVGAKSRDGGSPVTPGGPGAKAGIKAGDVITAVDGKPVHSGEELIVRTRAHRPGDRLALTVRRDGRDREVSLVLGSAGGD
ncbi:trypsin-like peptidase domain-containing protein [Streptomyces sp. NPDC093260]|uniref:S1C family serine protease n=1 Tax=Streptomyces sp. NPDC093260 TaxID=3155073 RepID=UPI0034389E3C